MKKLHPVTFLFFAFIIFGSFGFSQVPQRTFTSVLSDGQLYKVGIPQSGVYRLGYNDLQDLGVDLSNIDPTKIKLYTNYGGLVPERILEGYPDDLVEIPIIVNGGDDGSFDPQDVIYFYAEGPDKWKRNSEGYYCEKNIYDNSNYAFIKIGSTNGKRITQEESPNLNQTPSDFYEYLQIFEEDKVNLLGANASTEGSGKLWFGEKFDAGKIFDLAPHFNFDGSIQGPYVIQGRFASRAGVTSSTTLKFDDEEFTKNYASVSLTSM